MWSSRGLLILKSYNLEKNLSRLDNCALYWWQSRVIYWENNKKESKVSKHSYLHSKESWWMRWADLNLQLKGRLNTKGNLLSSSNSREYKFCWIAGRNLRWTKNSEGVFSINSYIESSFGILKMSFDSSSNWKFLKREFVKVFHEES